MSRALLVTLLAACSPQRPADTATFDLPTLAVAIDLPSSSVLEPIENGIVITVHPSARTPRRIHLTTGPAAPRIYRRKLADGVMLTYAVGPNEELGSGGEYILIGRIELGERHLGVTCEDQGEPPEPTWCIPWLATLRSTR